MLSQRSCSWPCALPEVMTMIIKWLRQIVLILLTIVANQDGNLVPDRTAVIQKLTDILDEMRDNDDGQ